MLRYVTIIIDNFGILGDSWLIQTFDKYSLKHIQKITMNYKLIVKAGRPRCRYLSFAGAAVNLPRTSDAGRRS